MNSISDRLRVLVEELRQGVRDGYDIILEGKADKFYIQSVDPHPLSLGEAYLKGKTQRSS